MRLTADDVTWLRECLVTIQDQVPRLAQERRVGGRATGRQLAEFKGRRTRDEVHARQLEAALS